ncbi:MAG: DNA polymerase III subunit beta [Clostridia bacterium]
MKFHCYKNALHEAVSSVQKAVSNKAIIPVLEGILIVAEKNKITFTGNDLETAIEYTLDGIVEEEGAIVLNSRIFNEIVRKLPDDKIEIIAHPDKKVEINCKNIHLEIKGLDPEGFPEVPKVDRSKSMQINNFLLREMIKQTIFSISSDEKMPVLTGALLESGENFLLMVTIDGYRMSLRKESVLGMKEGLKIVIPGKALGELVRLIKNEEESVHMFYEKNQILFDFGSLIFVSKLIQGEYIAYKSIYPDQYDTTVVVNTENLNDSIERAGLVIDEERKNPVSFEIKDEKMTVLSKTEIGNVTEVITVEKEGQDIYLSFNSKFLLDVLKNIEEETVKLSFSGELGPCVIEPVQGNEFSYVILPVRTS